MICKICGNINNNTSHLIKEMFIGTRDEFQYFECANCGCLQIKDVPIHLENYYPKDYYSFMFKKRNKLKRFFGRKRDSYIIFNKGLIGKVINYFAPNPFFKKIAKTNIDFDKKKTNILDVGCGSGIILQGFADMGFEQLTGVDPFIEKDIEIKPVKIYKKYLEELSLDEQYDLIIFNHSFEHIFDQLNTLKNVFNLLSDDGILVISIPIKTDYIWKKYGVHWVQIDAPRHFILHTYKSFKILLKKGNLKIIKSNFDSWAFQFYGSEQYKKNIPLKSPESYYINPKNSIFTSKEIKEFTKLSKKLNCTMQGDSATFYISKLNNSLRG